MVMLKGIRSVRGENKKANVYSMMADLEEQLKLLLQNWIGTLDSSHIDGNGKSLRDDVKDTVYGWISGGNDEKE